MLSLSKLQDLITISEAHLEPADRGALQQAKCCTRPGGAKPGGAGAAGGKAWAAERAHRTHGGRRDGLRVHGAPDRRARARPQVVAGLSCHVCAPASGGPDLSGGAGGISRLSGIWGSGGGHANVARTKAPLAGRTVARAPPAQTSGCQRRWRASLCERPLAAGGGLSAAPWPVAARVASARRSGTHSGLPVHRTHHTIVGPNTALSADIKMLSVGYKDDIERSGLCWWHTLGKSSPSMR